MKKTIQPAYIIIGTLLLTACGGEEGISYGTTGEGEKIIFHTSLPGVTSRATEIATDLSYFNLTAFNPADPDSIVDGFMRAYINNETITRTEGENTYTSDKCIWPAPGKEGDMTFFAYYPALNTGALTVNASRVTDGNPVVDYKITGFEVASDIAAQVDFVTATTIGSIAENLFSGINLNFEHQLSRIEVNAWGANKSCDIEIAGVRIGGVNVRGTFDFTPAEGTGVWSAPEKGSVEYVYRPGEEIVTLSNKNSLHNTAATAVSILGAALGEENNCAMLLPTADSEGWDFTTDRPNAGERMYISVLLRVKDTGGKLQYPYSDTKQGPDALNIPVEYLALDKATGKVVSARLFEKDGAYYTDKDCTAPYTVPENETVEKFGWASLPVTGQWQPGYVYTYTLDYTYGVGLHAPDTPASEGPNAGDPIISDKVGITVSVKGWQNVTSSGSINVPGS